MNKNLLRHELEIINNESSCVDVEFSIDSFSSLWEINNCDFSIELDRMNFINDYVIEDILSNIKSLWVKYISCDIKCRYGISFKRFFNLYSFKRKYLIDDNNYVKSVNIISKCLQYNKIDIILNKIVDASFNVLSKKNLNVVKYEIYKEERK